MSYLTYSVHDLKPALDILKKDLVDIVENEQVEMPRNNESEFKLTSKLNELFPHNHKGQVGEIDKLHVIWSRTLRDAVWLGWLSEAKKRKGAYTQEIVDAIGKSLFDAFTCGKEYAKDRP